MAMLPSMNSLAIELNTVLAGSVADPLLSAAGKRFYFPKGIVAQTAEANSRANLYNATVGMAFENNEPIELSAMESLIPSLSSKQSVAYAPTPGDKTLTTMWKEEILRKNPQCDSSLLSECLVVPGLTNGLSQIATLFVDPGDKIVIPDMFWGNYRLLFEIRQQGEIVNYPFYNEQGTLNTTACIEAMRSNHTNGKIIAIFNFPNNPTGYSPTKEEVRELVQGIISLADEGYKILTIFDDAYFGLFYEDDTYKQSIFAELSKAHNNILAVKIDGATKEHYVWGFRIGFLTFGSKGLNQDQLAALTTKTKGSIRASISNSSRIAQSLLLEAWKNKNYHQQLQEKADLLQARYRKVLDIVASKKENALLTPLPFNSGYFMSFSTKGDAEKLRLSLLDKGIGTIAIGSAFLRVAYASIDLEQLEDLYTEIYKTAEEVFT